MLYNDVPLTAQRFEHNVLSLGFLGAVCSLNLLKAPILFREYLIFFLCDLNHLNHRVFEYLECFQRLCQEYLSFL